MVMVSDKLPECRPMHVLWLWFRAGQDTLAPGKLLTDLLCTAGKTVVARLSLAWVPEPRAFPAPEHPAHIEDRAAPSTGWVGA